MKRTQKEKIKIARLSKNTLISKATDALAEGGWSVEMLTEDGTHPARFIMSQDGVNHVVKLYVWNLSHGGKSRSQDEYRIQITGVETFEPEQNGRTLLLGWSEDFNVFAGFDVQRRLGKMGASPSIQITAKTLQAAVESGASLQDKTKNEFAAALTPEKLGRYAQHLSTAHQGDLGPVLASEEDPASDPLASEISRIGSDAIGFNLAASKEPDLRSEILAGVADLLAALDLDGQQAPAQIGHNSPPGPVEDPDVAVAEVEAAATKIKVELEAEEPDVRQVAASGSFLAWMGKILRVVRAEVGQTIDKGKDIAREYAVKAVVGTVGTSAVLYKGEIVEGLRRVGATILQWLQQISVF
ncbi:hypothetical protein [uncultured Tateyamaria sp.]|uniref:hypothetical protein n=2 Tax=uncultured Tateyamaria sp. TaxID=455651 RepID=UPI00260736E8|nr:hypothetical protein [uncultured Tateyamaria sp.]